MALLHPERVTDPEARAKIAEMIRASGKSDDEPDSVDLLDTGGFGDLPDQRRFKGVDPTILI